MQSSTCETLASGPRHVSGSAWSLFRDTGDENSADPLRIVVTNVQDAGREYKEQLNFVPNFCQDRGG